MQPLTPTPAAAPAWGWRLVAPAGLVAVLALLASLFSLAASPAVAETPHPDRLFWAVRGDSVTLSNGWTLTTTNGTFVEVADERGRLLGYAELINFPLGDDLAAADSDGKLLRALRARVKDFHAVIGQDRERMERHYDYRAGGTAKVAFGDTFAVRYDAATVDTRGNEVIERIRGYMAVSANQLWVFAINGLDPDAFPSDLMNLTPQDAETLARLAGDVVKASPLPKVGAALEDGIVIGVDGGLNGGKVYLVEQGERARIAQPRPMTADDVRKAGLKRGKRIAHLDVTGRATGSWFAVVPADGPDARLHVVLGDTIHEVVVQAVDGDTAGTLTDTRRQWLDKLALPAP